MGSFQGCPFWGGGEEGRRWLCWGSQGLCTCKRSKALGHHLPLNLGVTQHLQGESCGSSAPLTSTNGDICPSYFYSGRAISQAGEDLGARLHHGHQRCQQPALPRATVTLSVGRHGAVIPGFYRWVRSLRVKGPALPTRKALGFMKCMRVHGAEKTNPKQGPGLCLAGELTAPGRPQPGCTLVCVQGRGGWARVRKMKGRCREREGS